MAWTIPSISSLRGTSKVAGQRRKPVYLDYGATTPVDPRVAEQMSRCLMAQGNFGNSGSRTHAYGWEAEEAVEQARVQVAKVLNADPREVIFTSGATESDNLALKGVAEAEVAAGGKRRHIVTSALEHKAILDPCAVLEARGFEVTYLAPERDGRVPVEQVQAALREDTLLVSIMHANNEIGVINDIAAIGKVCRKNNVIFHSDVAQSFGKVPIDVKAQSVDLLSISGHKIYGPKGVGALYIRRDPAVPLASQMHGGGQEMGYRSGTIATHQVVGLGSASALCAADMEAEGERILALRDRFWAHLKQIPGTVLNGVESPRLQGNLNVGFAGVDGETLIMALDDVAAANGSACNSTSVRPSHVLLALGLPEDLAHASLRFTFGRFTTEEEVDFAASRVADVVGGLQARNSAVST